MTYVVSVVAQKGGVGKSSLARTLAVEIARNEFSVLLADLDTKQSTSTLWNSRRLDGATQPEIAVQQFSSVSRALTQASAFDVVVFDSAPHATKQTQESAAAAHLVVVPTGLGLDDLVPTVKICHELKQAGVARERIAVVLARVGDSQAELAEASGYLQRAGYPLAPGSIPEKTGYRRALDTGYALTETRFATLNAHADAVIQALLSILQQRISEVS